ncbi:MAG TPA: transglycosylase SLT domain-containing protein [Candidatus Acidoferrales bacterium]|nr:transglycosylase SLT domain-containing protein [Candidatus Acidoferrales bacterium]
MEKIDPNISQIHPQFTEQQKTKLMAAAKDFEAVFMQYMLKSMEESEKISGQDDSEQGYGKDIMTGLFDTEMARYVTDKSNLGIGNMLYKQFTGEDMDSGISGRSNSIPEMLRQILPDERTRERVLQKIGSYSSGSVLENVGQYSDIINEAAGKYDVKPSLIKAVIAAESGGNADSVSTKNAKGLMQLVDTTAEEVGVKNVFDPRENIMGGTKYLKNLIEKFSGNIELVLASYNAGTEAVEQYKGVPPFNETQNYVKRVKSYLQMFDGEDSIAGMVSGADDER